MARETMRERARRLGLREEPNPFHRKRSANQRARYLNAREESEHPSRYDRAGNLTTSEG